MSVQAILINVTPPLFIPLKDAFGLSFEQIGRLILINFATQVVFDLVAGAFVDRVGPKPFAVGAQVLAMIGLWLLALAPGAFDDPYHGLVLGTVVFSMGAGILEMLMSPIVNAIPSDRKEADMSLLHSFYAFGQVAVIVVTVSAVFAFGGRHWWWIVLGWSILPALTAVGFYRVTIPPLIEPGRRTRLRDLVRRPSFAACLAAMALAGGTELVMAQWVSAFAERGLGYAKVFGDLAGLSLFATAMAVGRVWFGIKGAGVPLRPVMAAGLGLTIAAYLVAALSPWPAASLAACVAAGLGVSLLWPGMISLTAGRFPLAGASMFAVLSAAGDTGGALVPWAVGAVADRGVAVAAWLAANVLPADLTRDQLGLRAGLFVATACPVVMLAIVVGLRERRGADGATDGVPMNTVEDI